MTTEQIDDEMDLQLLHLHRSLGGQVRGDHILSRSLQRGDVLWTITGQRVNLAAARDPGAGRGGDGDPAPPASADGSDGAGGRGRGSRCASDIVVALTAARRRLPTTKLVAEMEQRGYAHGESTIKRTAAKLVEDGVIGNDNDGRGYYIFD